VRRGISAAELTSWAAGVFGSVATHLQRIGVPTIGDPFIRYLERGEHCEVEAGFPVAERISSKGEVRWSSLPAGPALATWHSGHPDELDEAFAALEAWIERQGVEAIDAPWVFHHPDPEAEPGADTWMSELIQPYRD
jgi:effector-binding domain-containing protein